MPTPSKAAPQITATWSQIAALRLDHQHLINRLPADRLLDVVREHVGIQAQVMSLAELQLNARIDGLRPDDIRDALWTHRSLVKTWAMRGTLHLIASDDLASFVAAAPTRRVATTAAWLKYFEVTKDELDAIFRTVDASLDGRPRTRAELIEAVAAATGRPDLAAKLQSGWGSFLKPSAGRGTLVFGPDRGRTVTFVDPEDWLGKSVRAAGARRPDPNEALGRLVERFLRLFPGADMPGIGRWWGGRYTMRKAIDAAGLDLVSVDVEGTVGLALRSDADVFAATKPFVGVRLLPGFDAYVNDLPRRIEPLMPVDRHADVHRVAGWVSPVVIVDGRVAGAWELMNGKRGGITVQPFGRWRGGARKEIGAEADRIAAFLDRPLPVDRVAAATRCHRRVDGGGTVVPMLFGAMFLNENGINPQLVGLAIAFAGWIVGFVWLRRIAGPDPDKEPSFWRYRQVDKVRRPSKVNWLPTTGWIATRLAMVVAVGVLAFVLLAPALLEAFGSAAAYAPWLWLASIGLASAGTFWIFRIARANPEGDTRSWRYRDF